MIGGACASTDAPADVAAFLRQRRRWFGGFLQTQYWYRDMVGNRRYGWLGTLMLPVKAFDTMQPIYGLTAVALLIAYLVSGRVSLVAADRRRDRDQAPARPRLPSLVGPALSALDRRARARVAWLRPCWRRWPSRSASRSCATSAPRWAG